MYPLGHNGCRFILPSAKAAAAADVRQKRDISVSVSRIYTVVAESLYTLCSNIRLFTLYWRIVLAYRKEKGVLFVQIFLC
jgi:hypothetical protein